MKQFSLSYDSVLIFLYSKEIPQLMTKQLARIYRLVFSTSLITREYYNFSAVSSHNLI